MKTSLYKLPRELLIKIISHIQEPYENKIKELESELSEFKDHSNNCVIKCSSCDSPEIKVSEIEFRCDECKKVMCRWCYEYQEGWDGYGYGTCVECNGLG